jgi:hypothetical protein
VTLSPVPDPSPTVHASADVDPDASTNADVDAALGGELAELEAAVTEAAAALAAIDADG